VLLLLDFGPVHERLVVHIAHGWRLTPAAPGLRVRLTLVGGAATRRIQALARRYPHLDRVCELVPCDTSTEADDFDERVAFIARSDPPVTMACVNTADDHAALAAGLRVVQQSPTQVFPVVVCATQARGLALLVAQGQTGDNRIAVVGIVEQGCAPELVLDGTNEILARAIHDEYIRSQAQAGHTVRTDAAMRPWGELAEGLRDSSRRQADHIIDKLDGERYAVVPRLDWDAPLASFTGDQVERLARAEHQRWVDERRAERWTPGPKSVENRTSPYLVDWDQLPPAVQDIDRHTVAQIPALLARVGLGLHRRDAARSGGGSPHVERAS
jgi:hypothetical protein